mgnify:CR=1 FL=1
MLVFFYLFIFYLQWFSDPFSLANPTYGKGPDHTLLLRQQGSKIAVNGKAIKAENTYEVPDDKNFGKKVS